MDISNALFTEQISPPERLPKVEGIENASDEQKKKLAKEFESLLVGRILEEMNNTIGDWGMEKEQAFGQVKGIFNTFLAKHVGDNGGFGLWEEIYESLVRMGNKVSNQTTTMDEKL
jgi:Rod binding domain-containing protein